MGKVQRLQRKQRKMCGLNFPDSDLTAWMYLRLVSTSGKDFTSASGIAGITGGLYLAKKKKNELSLTIGRLLSVPNHLA